MYLFAADVLAEARDLSPVLSGILNGIDITVWNPEKWEPRPEPVAAPRLDIYPSDRIDWKSIKVPAGIHVTDKRGTPNDQT